MPQGQKSASNDYFAGSWVNHSKMEVKSSSSDLPGACQCMSQDHPDASLLVLDFANLASAYKKLLIIS
jgi:hypothetical protein